VGSDGLRAQWHATAATVFYRRSRFDEVLIHSYTCLAYAGDGSVLSAAARQNIALVHLHRGEWQAALRLFTTVQEIYSALGNTAKVAQTAANRAVACDYMGAWDEAKQAAHDAIEAAHAFGDRRTEARGYLTLGNIAVARGERDAAASYLAEVRARVSEPRETALAHELHGELAALEKRYDDAAVEYAAAAELGRAIDPASDLIPEAERKLAEIRLAQGRHEEALALATRAVEAAQNISNLVESAASLRVHGEILAATGDAAVGRESLRRAYTLLAHAGEKYERAKTALALAPLVEAEERASLLGEARRLASELNSRPLLDLTRSLE
jgi:tetratricopeptide (TPR) repeat protein